jgi:ribosome-binding protein aMBF1 (putative translation factor)
MRGTSCIGTSPTKIIIEEEGELPRCPRCVNVGKATGQEQTKSCKEGAHQERPARHETEQPAHERNDSRSEKKRSETATEFKYLGRITSDDDDDPSSQKEFEEGETEVGPSLEIPREGATAKMMGSFT